MIGQSSSASSSPPSLPKRNANHSHARARLQSRPSLQLNGNLLIEAPSGINTYLPSSIWPWCFELNLFQTPTLDISKMDPLTVIGAVGGLIKTTASLSSTIVNIVSARNKGSSEITAIKITLDTIRSILHQLQTLLLKQANIDHERAAMLFAGDIVAILTSCVLTVSNLEGCIAGLKVADKLSLIDSIRWNSRMTEVRKYREELEGSKNSLNLVLTIMTWYWMDFSLHQCC